MGAASMSNDIIIRGTTTDGRKFRPSDWAQRLYYAVASYGPYRQVTFNPMVKLKVSDGVSCVVVSKRLEREDPMMFEFLIDFARDNDLLIQGLDNEQLAVVAA
jgi:Protein of unknown function (DUF3579)